MKRPKTMLGCICAALAVTATGAAPGSAAAAIAYKACPRTNNFACAKLQVPLDPSGGAPGTVTLSLMRHRAPLGEARTAIVALAGGPGQSAIPFAEDFGEMLGAIATTRDLIVFDQRGTGESGALHCKAFRGVSAATPPPAAMRSCAAQIGSARGYYGTEASVADIEAIRRAGGYEKLVLYGTSYGTKVAEDYAQAHPGQVEALVLDSVVGAGPPDALNRSSFHAVPRILREVCRRGVCRRLTPNPARDLAHVLSRIHGPGGLHGRVVGSSGHTRRVPITAEQLLGVLLTGDFSGPLRASLVSSLRSAALGDDAPLARLVTTVPGEAEESAETEGIDIPLYYATSCVDEAFPWNPAATPSQRLMQAAGAVRALGAKAFAPFDASDALRLSDIPACAYWPSGPAEAEPSGPLPAVPTLILSGAYDMRTPTANARALAPHIPGSHLLVVPRVGHSVLGAAGGECADRALQAMFAAKAIQACREGPVPVRLRPPARAPLHVGEIAPLRHYRGLPGRTARAVQMTLEDLIRQLALMIETSGEAESLLLAPALHVGGLRSGSVGLSSAGLSFHHYSYVPGMTLEGALHGESADLRIGGPGAAKGTLRLGRHHILVGTLGGAHVRLAASGERATAIVGADAAAHNAHDARGSAAGRDRLARILERLFAS